MLHECNALLFAYSLNIFKLACNELFFVQLSVILNRKPMHLILNICDKTECRARGVQQRLPLFGNHAARAMAVVLYHAEKRNVNIQLVKKLLNCIQLRNTAVKQNKVGHGGKFTVAFILFMCEAAAQCFTHGSSVVGAVNGADFEPPVFAARTAPVFEHNH